MKRILLAVIAVFVVTAAAQAQGASKKAEELVKFKELSYDFGKIKQGVPVTHDFVFTNISGSAVIVETANASCGCTTPTWPKPPVLNGKSDKITAGFNAAAPGPFNKSIYVKFAGADAPIEIKITGEVLSAQDFSKAK
jgi:Protein of unknown function (DUF1573)